MLLDAFYYAFTRKNIAASFAHADIWHVDPYRLLSARLPRSAEDKSTFLTVSELDSLLQDKMRHIGTLIIGKDAKLCIIVFVDTYLGMVLTYGPALALARDKAKADETK